MTKQSDDLEVEFFRCITDVSALGDGRRKRRIVVGTSPDARAAGFLFIAHVSKNWPSQWHGRFSEGYVEFSNGKRFDIARRTIDGQPAFLFFFERVEFLVKQRSWINEILTWAMSAEPREVWAFTCIASDVAGLPAPQPFLWWRGRDALTADLLKRLRSLGNAQLLELVTLIGVPVEGQPSKAA